ncbi:hypothetical protein ACJX0J_017939, partial [Zea mays]
IAVNYYTVLLLIVLTSLLGSISQLFVSIRNFPFFVVDNMHKLYFFINNMFLVIGKLVMVFESLWKLLWPISLFYMHDYIFCFKMKYCSQHNKKEGANENIDLG